MSDQIQGEYHEFFPSMVNTSAGIARSHRTWIRGTILTDARYDRAARAINQSRKLRNPQGPRITDDKSPPRKTVVRLVQGDTFAAARALHLQHPHDKIAVLNNANHQVPGGGYLNGSQAQEEDLCHCSTLYETLTPKHYPIQDDELIYSKDVLVVKMKDPRVQVGGQLMDAKDWFYTDVVSCAALRRPPVTTTASSTSTRPVDGVVDTYANPADRDTMKSKITNIVNAAVANGAHRLVLGAFGCGVFRNPVREVARIMREVLVDPNTADQAQAQGQDNAPRVAVVDWGTHGLAEVVIAIYDPLRLQPTFNAFMAEFRAGQGLHDPVEMGGLGVSSPEAVQYTVFPGGYVGVEVDV